MSKSAKIMKKGSSQKLKLSLDLRFAPLWTIANEKLAFTTLKRICDAINNVQKMDFTTPLFIAGGSVFRASIESDMLGDFDLWCKKSQKAAIMMSVQTAMSDTFGGYEISGGDRPHIYKDFFDIQICAVDDDCASPIEILSGFDLNASQWATDGTQLVYTVDAIEASTYGYIHPTYTDSEKGIGLTTEERISKYMTIWNAQVALPEEVQPYVASPEMTEKDDILF